mgnify:FL=1|jgi:hypothetical protein|tara:strand:+ start:632 stop:793 length:162 start_codon:yes stop_codon:yes gene_type:complete
MKLIVLNFFKDITYIYTIDKRLDDTEVESLLKEMGHAPTHCQWMLTKNEIIIK